MIGLLDQTPFFGLNSSITLSLDARNTMIINRKMARWEGFEPPTAWFVARNSIQLSYQRVEKNSYNQWVMELAQTCRNAGLSQRSVAVPKTGGL
jgi:hypothetical protein